jgi:hypothetical protein
MEWISVSERLPDHLEECLFANTKVKRFYGAFLKPKVIAGWHHRDGVFKSWLDPRDNFKATHWMPLPPPPTN